jgi:hypothetical protein
MSFDFLIETKRDLTEAVRTFGIVPLFRNSVPGFSVEEHVAPSAWFASEEGVWEWKGPVIRESGCAYGKFFEHKAAFVSAQWFPDLANARRDGYDFDARFDDGLASYADQYLYNLVSETAPVLTGTLKETGGYGKGGKKGFDTHLNRLQFQCYVVIRDFFYPRDKNGNPYGWGIAEYTTPEKEFGAAFTERVYLREPAESRERLLAHLKSLLPGADEGKLRAFLR